MAWNPKLLAVRVLSQSNRKKRRELCLSPSFCKTSGLQSRSLLFLSHGPAEKIDPGAIYIQEREETAFDVQANICILICEWSAAPGSVGT